MPIQLAVPVLRVADIDRSLRWYRDVLGFVGDPFPDEPPYQFAILRHGTVELMLRCAEHSPRRTPKPYDWDVYLRLEGTPFRDVHARLQAAGQVTRGLERMFYGLAEFELTAPDGYVICLSQAVTDGDDLPTPHD